MGRVTQRIISFIRLSGWAIFDLTCNFPSGARFSAPVGWQRRRGALFENYFRFSFMLSNSDSRFFRKAREILIALSRSA